MRLSDCFSSEADQEQGSDAWGTPYQNCNKVAGAFQLKGKSTGWDTIPQFMGIKGKAGEQMGGTETHLQ
jgi:hypothetical protein